MPRKRRQPSPTGVYHWIARGIHRKNIFHDTQDFNKYLDLIMELKELHALHIYHYCLMDNHIHMLIFSSDLEALSVFSHFLQRKYVYYYCQRYKWVGKLFQGRYKAIPIDDDRYLLECGRYIERNPLKAHVCRHPAEYPYSSYHTYVGLKTDKIVNLNPAYLGLHEREDVRREMYAMYVTQERLDESKKAKVYKLV